MAKTFSLEIYGYGAEMCVGTITKEQFEFWEDQEEDAMLAHAFWDPYETDQDDENPNPITDDEDPRFLGYWHECDDITHTNGALFDGLTVVVTDEDGNEVYKTHDIPSCDWEYIDKDDLDPGYYVHAYSSEKGCFYQGEFEAEEFDPAKLSYSGTNVLGDTIVDIVQYGDEMIDNDGGDTRGKSSGISVFEVV